MSERTRKELSEQEGKSINDAMVAAAMSALGEQVDPSDMDQSSIARRIVLAIRSARASEKKMVKYFEEKYDGSYVSWKCVPVIDAVASAYWWWLLDGVELDEPPVAGCIGSVPYVAFAQAMIAATLAGLGSSALDDEEGAFFCLEDGANLLTDRCG